MRKFLCVVLGLMAVLPMWANGDKQAKDTFSKDPRALLAAAAPYYDFSSPEMKPWHLKATYQLYDEQGKPTEQGTYEYWWASPKVYRSTWTRKGARASDWHTADGKVLSLRSGEILNYFEGDLRELMVSPLPDKGATDAKDYRLERREVRAGPESFACVMAVPDTFEPEPLRQATTGEFATYCFGGSDPILRFSYRWGQVTIEYERVAKMQERYLPLSLKVMHGTREMFSASVDQVDSLNPQDAALVPDKGAEIVGDILTTAAGGTKKNQLVKKEFPVYPAEAKNKRIQGTVVLAATIGTDGSVQNLQLVVSPSPLLTNAAIKAVKDWRYRPYTENGVPVEVKTTIRVIFTLGG